MKRHWLRGVLLGVSMALLLAGGVALAQGLFMTVGKECVACWSGEGDPTQDQYLLPYTMGGWDTNYEMCARLTIDGILEEEHCSDEYPDTDPISDTEWFPCEWAQDELLSSFLLGGEVNVSNGPPSPLGMWKYELWQNIPGRPNPHAEASWLVAEVCEVEFVPEPGTMLLLGSGLAGLAGYATLRWRTRE